MKSKRKKYKPFDDRGEELGVRVQLTSRSDAAEHRMVSMIDRIREFKDYKEHFEKIKQGSLEVPAFYQELANEALMVTIESLRAEDPRLAFDAAKDVMDRAGYGKTQKIAVGHVHMDHQTSKMELINMIMSSAKKAGLGVKEEDYVQGQLPEADNCITIDAELPDAPDKLKAGNSVQVSDETKKSERDDKDN